MTTATDLPPLTTEDRVRLASTEGERVLDLLRSLPPERWSEPSGCAGWDVTDLAAHLLGQCDQLLSMREALRQDRAGKRLARGRARIDGITEFQVQQRRHLGRERLLGRLGAALPAAADRRRRFPFTSERVRLRIEVPAPGGVYQEPWSFAYMAQVLTRDLWMHRADLSLALGLPMVLTPDHDGRLVADVVRDWARRHGGPFRLVLDGPAGGAYAVGDRGPDLHLDAVEFCRRLFGRGEPLHYGVTVPF